MNKIGKERNKTSTPSKGRTRLGWKLSTETIAAINGAVATRLEGNLTRLSALRAYGIEHGTRTAAITGVALAGATAALATLGLVIKAFFCEKLLLAGSKGELLAAILADDGFVLKHVITSFLLVRFISDDLSYG